MFHGHKRRRCGGALAVCAAVCLGASGAALPASAQAYEQIYCQRYVAALSDCNSSGLHSWYYNSAATDSGQTVCSYMWNAHNGVVRGGSMTCNYSFAYQQFNHTSDLWYNARNYNGTYGAAIYMVGDAIA